MKKKLEQNLQQEIIIYANKYLFNKCVLIPVVNELARNSHHAILSGCSDLILVLPTQTIFIELKYGRNVLTAKQRLFRDRVVKLNHEFYICRSLDDFKKIINDKAL